MLFALWDYLLYRKRCGPYGNNSDKNAMAIGHTTRLPREVVEALDVGDIIFTQGLRSTTSWGVMYFSNADCDHCATYIGNGYIMHMTLSGSRVDKLNVLYGQTRLLPVKMTFLDGGPPPGYREGMTPEAIANWGRPPINKEQVAEARRTARRHSAAVAKRRLYLAAVQIQLGMMPNTFSWRKFGDNVLVGLAIAIGAAPIGSTAFYFGGLYVLLGPIWQCTFILRRRLKIKVRPTTNLKWARLSLIARGALIIPDWTKIDRTKITAIWRRPS